jgi:hypothetical protein
VSDLKIKLIWIEKDFRGNEVALSQEILHGESAKTPTRNQVAKLIARLHPELISVTRVSLLNSSETSHKWYVKSNQLGPNRWLTVYADPMPDD